MGRSSLKKEAIEKVGNSQLNLHRKRNRAEIFERGFFGISEFNTKISVES